MEEQTGKLELMLLRCLEQVVINNGAGVFPGNRILRNGVHRGRPFCRIKDTDCLDRRRPSNSVLHNASGVGLPLLRRNTPLPSSRHTTAPIKRA